MSGLAMLGGIGQGVMQGSQFIHQKREQDARAQAEQARLGMLNEEQQWKREDRQLAQTQREQQAAEQQRAAAMNQLYMQTAQELGPEVDPLVLDTEVFKRSVASGHATKAELEPLLKSVGQLRQRGITNAIRTGDTEKLGGLFSQHYGRPVRMQVSQGKDEYGQVSPVYSIVGEDGKEVGRFSTPQLASILGADDMIAEEERRLSMRKTGAEIGLAEARSGAARDAGSASRASAGKYSAEAQGVRLKNEGLAALPAAQRGASDREAPTSVREAEWYRTASPEQREAYDKVKRISNDPDVAKAALQLMQADVTGKLSPEAAVAKVRQTYNAVGGNAPAAEEDYSHLWQ